MNYDIDFSSYSLIDILLIKKEVDKEFNTGLIQKYGKIINDAMNLYLNGTMNIEVLSLKSNPVNTNFIIIDYKLKLLDASASSISMPSGASVPLSDTMRKKLDNNIFSITLSAKCLDTLDAKIISETLQRYDTFLVNYGMEVFQSMLTSGIDEIDETKVTMSIGMSAKSDKPLDLWQMWEMMEYEKEHKTIN